MGKHGKQLKRIISKSSINAVRLDVDQIANLPKVQDAGDFIRSLSGQNIITENVKCRYCLVRFTTVEQLREHDSIDVQKKLCHYTEIGKFDTSRKAGIQISAICPIKNCCNQRYLSSEEYFGHLQSSHSADAGILSSTSIFSYIHCPKSTEVSEEKNICSKCERPFAQKAHKTRHERSCSGRPIWQCSICHQSFISHADEIQHVFDKHKAQTFFNTRLPLNINVEPQDLSGFSNKTKSEKREKERLKNLKSPVRVIYKVYSQQTFLKDALNFKSMKELESEILFILNINKTINVHVFCDVVLSKVDASGVITFSNGFLRTPRYFINGSEPVTEVLHKLTIDLAHSANNIAEKCSGWSLSHVRNFECHVIFAGMYGGAPEPSQDDVPVVINTEILGKYFYFSYDYLN